MVVSLLPLPGLSVLDKSFDVDPSPITTEKADLFWMNYMNLVPVYRKNGKRIEGWWTFVELDRLDMVEDFDIVDHKVFEGKPWCFEVTRVIQKRKVTKNYNNLFYNIQSECFLNVLNVCSTRLG